MGKIGRLFTIKIVFVKISLSFIIILTISAIYAQNKQSVSGKVIDEQSNKLIYLLDSSMFLKEIMVVGERIRGKSENGKTVFNINKKIADISGSGTDVLKYIPGIQVDLKQNISLEGSFDIILLVNGIERDKGFVKQLIPSMIDKIEVVNTPSSNYDSNISGIINIILKKESNTGVNGQIYIEVPTSKSEVYLFPTYNINYNFNKIILFTSYNGEINYENIKEERYRERWDGIDITEISSIQDMRQKNLSHKFHYGFDYLINSQNLFNYYGFYNPYSNEQNGKVVTVVSENKIGKWDAKREENDLNSGIFNSLYYKHKFNMQGKEITVDLSNYYLKANNSTSYLCENIDINTFSYSNNEQLRQNATTIKLDYTAPLSEKVFINTGGKIRYSQMQDKSSDDFNYNEQVYAIYGSVNIKYPQYNISIGLRAEDSESELKNNVSKSFTSLLPYTLINYKPTERQNIKLSFNSSIKRPNIYQLNSSISVNDPYAVSKGNPKLKPEFRNIIYIEHSILTKKNYISSRLFYNRISDAINNLTSLNDSSAFETQIQNLGSIHQYGLQLSGSLKFGPVMLNPSVRLYNQSTLVNQLVAKHLVENKSGLIFESSLSSVLSLNHDLSFSLIFQYSTPKNNIQDNSFCGALYFISIDKIIKQTIKLGIVSTLPLTKSFVYHGSELEAPYFSTHYQGNLKLSTFPVMFRISFQFNSGKNKELIGRDIEQVELRSKKGF